MATYKVGDTTIIQMKFGALYVKRYSTLSGREHAMTMTGTTAEDLVSWLGKREKGQSRRLIQDEFPMLTTEEREFLISGITPTEWKAMFPPETKVDEEGET